MNAKETTDAQRTTTTADRTPWKIDREREGGRREEVNTVYSEVIRCGLKGYNFSLLNG